jgi:hypothetical protein
VALVVTAGTTPTLLWTMVDRDGAAVSLTDVPASGTTVTVAFKMKEYAAAEGSIYVVDATCVDPAHGLVEAPVDLTKVAGPGVYVGEFAVFTTSDTTLPPLFVNRLYVVVEGSLFSADQGKVLTIAAVKLHLRNSSPVENRLLDALLFDEAEIAECMTLAVDYWNAALPPLGPQYAHTTKSFPYRYHWLRATTACLLRIAAQWYRNNHLTYNAGGVAVDDLNKAQECEQIADKIWDGEYKPWVQSQRVSINMAECFGDVGSPYGYRGYYGWY